MVELTVFPQEFLRVYKMVVVKAVTSDYTMVHMMERQVETLTVVVMDVRWAA